MTPTLKQTATLAAAALLAAGVHSAQAGPNYTSAGIIAIPAASTNPNPGGTFTAFDISFFDPTTGLDYVADRSNGGIDIFSGSTLSFVGRASGFVGQQATTSVSGPDGVLVATVGGVQKLFGGDGNSSLRTYDVSTPAAPVLTSVTPTGGTHRVDEMAFSPTANLVLAANNADAPAFATLFNASTGAIVHGNIVIPGAGLSDGLEQPVWDPNTGTFFVSVPTFGGGTDPGGIATINTDGTVGKLYKFASFGIGACSAAGLALGGSGNLLVGCGAANSQTIIFNPTANAGAGAVVASLSQVSGSDEVYYDPTGGNFFATGAIAGGARVIDVISDTTDTVTQTIALGTTGNAHSVAVDPLNQDIFVPLPAGSSACSAGCIQVFAVPEPATLPLLATVALAAFGLTRRRRIKCGAIPRAMGSRLVRARPTPGLSDAARPAPTSPGRPALLPGLVEPSPARHGGCHATPRRTIPARQPAGRGPAPQRRPPPNLAVRRDASCARPSSARSD